jgi:hypothetical protein
VKPTIATALRNRIESDPLCAEESLEDSTDQSLSIGWDVWRLLREGQATTAVGTDADIHTTCGALLDAIVWREHLLHVPSGPPEEFDPCAVNVLVDRPFPRTDPSETDQALRTMRDAVASIRVRIWYQGRDGGWFEDSERAPVWPAGTARINGWVTRLLLPRLTSSPSEIAMAFVQAVNDPSLHLYPSEVTKSHPDKWALRVDGLEVGVTDGESARLTIGKDGSKGPGRQRRAFTEKFGAETVTASFSPSDDEVEVDWAAQRLNELLREFRHGVEVPGCPITHRVGRNGSPIVDEHSLEARLLSGLVAISEDDYELILDDHQVARGSQFPTLWGLEKARPRYLDALLRKGTTPVAIELKVATGGQGRYYRRSIVQAVLYRHFIRNAPDLDPWFETAGLRRSEVTAAIGIPVPRRWTPQFERDLVSLRKLGENLDVAVFVLDDRYTPDWVAHQELEEPDDSRYEYLSWKVAAALARRWPTSLGRVLEVHPLDGLYDMVRLQALADKALQYPSPLPRVSLNRPGSLWVHSQIGSERWAWRGIWNYLTNGGDVDEAARIVGEIAGLGSAEPARPTFAELAHTFLEAVGNADWSWRCAWSEGYGSPETSWTHRYRPVLRQYYRKSSDGSKLPTIARIWGALHQGDAEVIIDQENLRIWVWDGAPHELTEGGLADRVHQAARLFKR